MTRVLLELDRTRCDPEINCCQYNRNWVWLKINYSTFINCCLLDWRPLINSCNQDCCRLSRSSSDWFFWPDPEVLSVPARHLELQNFLRTWPKLSRRKTDKLPKISKQSSFLLISVNCFRFELISVRMASDETWEISNLFFKDLN